jgi:hypothetical protein
VDRPRGCQVVCKVPWWQLRLRAAFFPQQQASVKKLCATVRPKGPTRIANPVQPAVSYHEPLHNNPPGRCPIESWSGRLIKGISVGVDE